MKLWLQALVAYGLAAGAVSANALTSAKVSIAQPTITVVDLNPIDGIDAAYGAGGMSLTWFQAVLGPSQADPRYIEGSATVDETVLSLQGSATAPNAVFLGVAERWAPSFTFTVTPQTRVTIEVGYELSGVIDGEPFGGAVMPRALASFEFGLLAANNFQFDPETGLLANYDEATIQFQTVTVDSDTSPQRLIQPQGQGVLSMSFENLSRGEAVFAFRGQMVVLGNTADVAAAVPEPSSWALAGIGIGLMAFWSRRRRAVVSSRN